jgi:hypothetical protein
MFKESVYIVVFCLLSLWMMSCHSSNNEIHLDQRVDRDIAEDVEMIYTDSAMVLYKVRTPREESYHEEHKLIKEYPQGIDIEFLKRGSDILHSSVSANYARHVLEDGLMLLRDSVVLVNAAGDRLLTTGITWNEVDQTLSTKKYVQLVKASSKDTFYGYGFEAKDDFSQFRITQFVGKRKIQSITD